MFHFLPLPRKRRRPACNHQSASRNPRRVKCALEVLEDRLLPAAFVVTNLQATGPGSLYQAAVDAGKTAGQNTITFDPSLRGAISLSLPGNTSLAIVLQGNVDLEGPGEGVISVDAGRSVAGEGGFLNGTVAFAVAPGATVVIAGLSVASGPAGGISNAGDLTLNHVSLGGGSQLPGSTPSQGGGIYNTGTLTLNETTVGSCTANAGGGIYNSGTLTLNQSRITGNTAYGTAPGSGGAGIFNTGMLAINSSQIDGNKGQSGGGIKQQLQSGSPPPQLTVTASTLSGNTAATGAGGIDVESGTALVSNSTISSNQGQGTTGGNNAGGIGNYGGTLTVLDSTLSGNTAGGQSAGGIDSVAAAGAQVSTTVKNTLVALNTGGSGGDVAGGFTSQGHNLVGRNLDATGFTAGVNGDQVGTAAQPIDPLLGPLQNNGGPTLTQALLPGSPAIDAGDNSGAPPTDQRGNPRIAGAAIDVGAFETASNGGASTPTQLYVTAVYENVLGRPPDSFGLTYWSTQLDQGTARGAVAAQLTHSAEYYGTIITPAYTLFLGRSPDTTGLAFWVGQMQSGLTDEQLEAGFIGSPEYYQHSGGTDRLWVDAMYVNLLGHAPDPTGESFWVQQLGAGASRTGVAYGFAASQEREGQHVQQDYQNYLARTAAASEVSYWVGRFAQGVTNEDIITGFIASDEYYQKHSVA